MPEVRVSLKITCYKQNGDLLVGERLFLFQLGDM